MPVKIDREYVSTPRRAVLERPECAILLAAIVAEWAYVEDMLASMFCASMGSHTLDEAGVACLNRSWPAIAAMRVMQSNEARYKLVEEALIPMLTVPLQERWKGLKNRLKTHGSSRNVAAHTTWAISTQHPNALVAIDEKNDRATLYTIDDFSLILDGISSLCHELHDFLHAVLAAQRAGDVSMLP